MGEKTEKPFWQSKTFWFNVALGLGAVSGYVPAEYAAPVSAAGNVILRMVTKTGIQNPLSPEV